MAAPNRKSRQFLAIAAMVTLIGVAFSVARGEDLGKYVSAGGVLALIFGIHRLGRTGPDEAGRKKRRRTSEVAGTNA